jgi:hypothetical protein
MPSDESGMKMSILMLLSYVVFAPGFTQASSESEFKLGSSLVGDAGAQQSFDVDGIHSAQKEKLKVNTDFVSKRAVILEEIARNEVKLVVSHADARSAVAAVTQAKKDLARAFMMYEAKYDAISAKEQTYGEDLFKLNPHHLEAMKPRAERSIASIGFESVESRK